MKESDKTLLREKISQQFEQAKKDIVELEELCKPVPLDASIGRVSRMDAINNKTINEAALRDKKNLLKRLERTLDRMEAKEFGVCEKCGETIPMGRLEIMPFATQCVKCAR